MNRGAPPPWAAMTGARPNVADAERRREKMILERDDLFEATIAGDLEAIRKTEQLDQDIRDIDRELEQARTHA